MYPLTFRSMNSLWSCWLMPGNIKSFSDCSKFIWSHLDIVLNHCVMLIFFRTWWFTPPFIFWIRNLDRGCPGWQTSGRLYTSNILYNTPYHLMHVYLLYLSPNINPDPSPETSVWDVQLEVCHVPSMSLCVCQLMKPFEVFLLISLKNP